MPMAKIGPIPLLKFMRLRLLNLAYANIYHSFKCVNFDRPFLCATVVDIVDGICQTTNTQKSINVATNRISFNYDTAVSHSCTPTERLRRIIGDH